MRRVSCATILGQEEEPQEASVFREGECLVALGDAPVVIRTMSLSPRGLDLHSGAMESLRLYGGARHDGGVVQPYKRRRQEAQLALQRQLTLR